MKKELIKTVALYCILFICIFAHIAYMWHIRGDFGVGGEWLVYTLAVFAALFRKEIHWEE